MANQSKRKKSEDKIKDTYINWINNLIAERPCWTESLIDTIECKKQEFLNELEENGIEINNYPIGKYQEKLQNDIRYIIILYDSYIHQGNLYNKTYKYCFEKAEQRAEDIINSIW
jgi:hypothetical protein